MDKGSILKAARDAGIAGLIAAAGAMLTAVFLDAPREKAEKDKWDAWYDEKQITCNEENEEGS